MKTPIIATASLVFLFTGACDGGGQNGAGHEISEDPLSGVVFGEAWSFVNGDTNASLSEGEDDFFSQLYPVEFDTCLGSHPSENELVLGIPQEPGEYPLGWEQTITFSDGSTNLASTNGQLDVYEITDTTISAGLYATYGDDNEVNGRFEVEICDGTYETDDSDTGVDSGDDTDPGYGFSIRGKAVDIQTDEEAAAGLCVEAVDPTNVLLGGAPEILGSDVLGGDGTFEIAHVSTDSAIGIMLVVDDCDGGADSAFPTATGISEDDYENLGDGDILSDRTAYSITTAYRAVIDSGLTTAGSPVGISEGALLGFIQDEDGQPISGATITDDSSSVTSHSYYADDELADGLFTTGTIVNNSTAANAGAFYIIPDAPITTYKVSAYGHAFSSRLAGAMPGWATCLVWTANPQ